VLDDRTIAFADFVHAAAVGVVHQEQHRARVLGQIAERDVLMREDRHD
jgi:hypothetical protein